MIYGYYLEDFIHVELLKTLPLNSFQHIQSSNKLLNRLKENDFVLFFNYKHRKTQTKINDKGIKMFPDYQVSTIIENRWKCLLHIKEISKFPLQREFNLSYSAFNIVPNIGDSDYVVVKQNGNYHQGDKKYLIKKGLYFHGTNCIFEEYLPDARSIRILVIDKNNVYIIEQINNENWLKNINPSEEKVWSYKDRYDSKIENIDSIIEDALNISKFLNHEYLGIDYVIGETKTGLLEVNDMIGIPYNKQLRDNVKHFFKNLINRNIQYE